MQTALARSDYAARTICTSMLVERSRVALSRSRSPLFTRLAR
jgi:hypothetical protein